MSTSGGTLTDLSASPSINVYAADGGGTMTSNAAYIVQSSAGNTITFTYTAGTGGMSNGTVTLVVPSGWNAPSLTGTDPGYTTVSSGTLLVSTQTITVSNVTLSANGTLTVIYGSKSSGGSGATAPGTAQSQTWQAQESSSSSGTLTNLSASPVIPVVTPYMASVLTDSPSLYYRLDDTAGPTAVDSSGNRNDGTYSASGITYSQTGALTNETDNAIQVTSGNMNDTAGTVAATSPSTVELWFNSTATSFGLIITPAAGLEVVGSGSGLHWYNSGGGSAAGPSFPYAVDDGKWHLFDAV